MTSLSTKQTEEIVFFFFLGGGGGGAEGNGVLRWDKTFPPLLGHVVY